MYKIIQNNKIVDVVSTPLFVKVVSPNNVILVDKYLAEGIIGSDNETLYGFAPNKHKAWDIVTIQEISEEEFNRLSSLLNSGQEITADKNSLTKAQREKIQQLSSMCNNKIVQGFSVILSDGESYGFKLTIEDQINLTLLETQLNAGESTFIYHATNQPCRSFNREDMLRIIRTFRQFVLYHTTYFNLTKQYIKSLTDIEKVRLFTYGTDISDTVNDIVLKQILKNGENF